MYSNTSRTPDKKNSYLNKFKKKQIATTDKENRTYNISNLSTNINSSDECKSHFDSVDYYKQENQHLKRLVINLKLEMKSQIENSLIDQKSNLKEVVSQYSQFIDKLLQDKRKISSENEQLQQQLSKQQELIEQQTKQIYNQQVIIESNLNIIQTQEQQLQEQKIEMEEILYLKDATIDQLNHVIQLLQ